MKKKLNFVIRNINDTIGYTEAILSELEKEYELGNKIIIDCAGRIKAYEDAVYLEADVISTSNEKVNTYDNYIDGSILEAMLPYKSMAMHMMMRQSHYDIYEYRYLEDEYYKIVAYFWHLLVDYQINCFIDMVSPHHCGEYVLYALCQVMNVPTVTLYPSISYKGLLMVMGTGLETYGESVADKYHTLKERKVTVEYTDLNDYFKKAIEQVKHQIPLEIEKRDEKYKRNEVLLTEYGSLKTILLETLKKPYIYFRGEKTNEERIATYRTNMRKFHLEMRKRARKAEKRYDHLDDYDKYAVIPNLTQKYIYFGLQFQPESSTMPMAGEFKNQLLSIRLLAEAAGREGLQVYVKEHWVQPHREQGFYKTLFDMEHVVLVDRKITSIELMKNAVAVSTQTGTMIFEALILKKAAFAFSNGNVYKGAPNVMEVFDLADIVQPLHHILNGEMEIADADVYRYLKALEEETCLGFIDDVSEAGPDFDMHKSAKKIADYFVKYADV